MTRPRPALRTAPRTPHSALEFCKIRLVDALTGLLALLGLGFLFANARLAVEYIRFLKMARGSLAELRTQILLARDLGFLKLTQDISSLLDEVERLLAGLIKSLRVPMSPQLPARMEQAL